jgi:hypothetical protein
VHGPVELQTVDRQICRRVFETGREFLIVFDPESRVVTRVQETVDEGVTRAEDLQVSAECFMYS